MKLNTETIYLGLFMAGGKLQTARVKQVVVVTEDDGTEIARQEKDEACIPDGDPVESLIGEALATALKTNQDLSGDLAAEKAKRAAEQSAHAEAMQQAQLRIDSLAAKVQTLAGASA